jgi:hypothetical protein
MQYRNYLADKDLTTALITETKEILDSRLNPEEQKDCVFGLVRSLWLFV